MSQTIRCTSCGAPATNRSDNPDYCEFCGSRFEPQKRDTDLFQPTPSTAPVTPGTAQKVAKPVLLALVAGVFVAMGLTGAVFFLLADVGMDDFTAQPMDEPAFATEIQRMGGQGTGAGKFVDNRDVGIDAKGYIYSADYTGERVQVFDAAGNFRTQWPIPRAPIQDMCVSPEGTVYLCQELRITAYEGSTGKQLHQGAESVYGNMALQPDGTLLLALANGGMAKLDKSLNRMQEYEDLMQKAGAESPVIADMATNASGELFMLDFKHRNVYRFSADFTFSKRFAAEGMMPNHLAVDKEGRVFVGSISKIAVYTGEGEPIGSLATKQAFGMAFDKDNNLWVADRPYLVKYKSNK